MKIHFEDPFPAAGRKCAPVAGPSRRHCRYTLYNKKVVNRLTSDLIKLQLEENFKKQSNSK